MERQFVVDAGFPHDLKRSRAKGYKSIVIDESATPPSSISFESDIDSSTLILKGSEISDETAEAEYTILCKEFGLFGYSAKFVSNISVIFCDNGWMFVTLHKGALAINLFDDVKVPVVGYTEVPRCDLQTINWVDAEVLLGYVSYLGDKGNFSQDFEFGFDISGSKINGMKSIKVKHIAEQDIDISLGVFAKEQEAQEMKAQVKRVKEIQNMVFSSGTIADLEFDEPAETGESVEEDDDDEYDSY